MKKIYIITLIVLAVLASEVWATDYTVDTEADVVASDGMISLREAVTAANTDAVFSDAPAGTANDTITFAASVATITLASQLDIIATMTIDGGTSGVILSGNNLVRVFSVSDTGNLSLVNLTVMNGRFVGNSGGGCTWGGGGGGSAGVGGGIWNQGVLTVTGCTFTGNRAQGGSGGVPDPGNRSGAGGGGLEGPGAIDTGDNGGAGGNPNPGGGGVYPGGNGSNGGFGGGGGGGARGQWSGTIRGGDGGTGGWGGGGGGGGNRNNSVAAGNGGNGGFGGGGGGNGCFDSSPPGTIGGHGGFGGGDGATNQGYRNNGGGGGAGLGGAICNYEGTVTITNSTFSNNFAVGGAGGPNGQNGTGYGAAIFNYDGTLQLNHVTVSNNSGGGVVSYVMYGASMTINNSILANSSAGQDCYVAGFGPHAIGGSNNLIESHSGFTGGVSTNSDPILGSLTDNGGPTLTHLPAPTSPARLIAANGLASDQRGYTRDNIGMNDAGSVELREPTIAGSGANPTFIEDNGPVIIDGGMNITFAGPSQLGSASVAITSGFHADNDVLDFTPAGGITGNYNGTTGVLSLSGNALVSDYLAVLQSVTFNNTSNGPITANREITYKVVDFDGLESNETKVNISISASNDSPEVSTTIPDQTAPEDANFLFQIPGGTFTDPDLGDTLTLSAELQGGGALPGWLNFDPASGTFDGTPLNADVGTISIDVIATDAGGPLSVTDTFDITVQNTNDVPVLVTPLTNQNATEDVGFNYTVPLGTFVDPDVGDTLTLSAAPSVGGPLPSWLTFDAGTGNFIGTPGNENVGTLTIVVTATDVGLLSATDSFDITIANTNDPPVIVAAIPDQNISEDTFFTYTIPPDTFADPDTGDTFTVTVGRGGGGSLPSWLTFTSATQTFEGTPSNDHVGIWSIDVIATDVAGPASVTDTFHFVVANTNDAPTFTGTPSIEGIARPGQTLSLVDLGTEDVDGDTVTLTYQWCADGLDIPGATSATYDITRDEKGKNITCIITSDDGNGGSATYTTDGVVVKSFPIMLFIPNLVQ